MNTYNVVLLLSVCGLLHAADSREAKESRRASAVIVASVLHAQTDAPTAPSAYEPNQLLSTEWRRSGSYLSDPSYRTEAGKRYAALGEYQASVPPF